MKPTVLFLFNSSSYALQPWLEDGRFNVVTVDYDKTDHSDTLRATCTHPNLTRLSIDLSRSEARLAVLWALRARGIAEPSLVVSFAPCTDLAVSGAKHFAAKLARDPDCQNRAVRMAKLASEFDCAYAVENPVSRLATLWRKPDHYWHPWHYTDSCPAGPHPEFPDVIPADDWYNKKSCLWVGNGFKMPPQERTLGPKAENPGWAKLGGKSARTKHIRSLTPRGFARAIYLSNVNNLLDSDRNMRDNRTTTNRGTEECQQFTISSTLSNFCKTIWSVWRTRFTCSPCA